MPTSIDAAIREAIAAIDAELNSDSSCGSDSSSETDSVASEFSDSVQVSDPLKSPCDIGTPHAQTRADVDIASSILPSTVVTPRAVAAMIESHDDEEDNIDDSNGKETHQGINLHPQQQELSSSDSSLSLDQKSFALRQQGSSGCLSSCVHPKNRESHDHPVGYGPVFTETSTGTPHLQKGWSSSQPITVFPTRGINPVHHEGLDEEQSDDAESERSTSGSDEGSDEEDSGIDSDFGSEYDSDESSDLSDDQQYILPPPASFNPHFKRASSLPRQFGMNNGEMTTTQVSALLNQMRISTAAANKTRLSSSAPDERKLYLGGPSHFQGESMDGNKPDRTRIHSLEKKSSLSPFRDERSAKLTDDPNDLFQSILEDAGYEYREFHQDEVNDFFHGVDSSRVNSYSLEVIAAVKHGDIGTLQNMYHHEKQNMNCCNRFGESVLHAACRGGSSDVVRFLLEEAKVELRVRDDYGRTPMHDACWTPEPNMENILMIVQKWPDLMLVKDKRGFSPLKYVRRDQFPAWIEFLDEHHEAVLPKLLIRRDGVQDSHAVGPIACTA